MYTFLASQKEFAKRARFRRRHIALWSKTLEQAATEFIVEQLDSELGIEALSVDRTFLLLLPSIPRQKAQIGLVPI
jgi:hypothetical protein